MVPQTTRDFGGIRIDTTAWPLIVWNSPRDSPHEAVMRALEYLVQVWKATPADTKSFLVCDLSLQGRAPSASERREIASFLALHDKLQRKALLGGALVVSSAIVRGVITAVFWLRPPAVPQKAFGTRAQAVTHAIEQIERHAGVLPRELRELRQRMAREGVAPAHPS
jgi:hypothetical protein